MNYDASARRWKIVEEIYRKGSVRFADVVALFGDCKATTLSNDLKLIADLGLASRRSHSVYVKPTDYQPDVDFQSVYEQRLNVKSREKTAIARYIAANHILDGSMLFLDGGTQVSALATELSTAQISFDVFTSNFDAARILMRSANVGHIRLKSGELNRKYAVVAGPLTDFERSWGIDIAVVGVSGVSAEGLSSAESQQHELKRSMLGAPLVLVPATHDKLGKRRGTFFSQLADIAGRFNIVTDNNVADIDPTEREAFDRATEELSRWLVIVNERGDDARGEFVSWDLERE